MSAPIDHLARLNAPIERRFYPRVAPQAPETVLLERHTSLDTQSSLLNLSENGLLLSTASTLDVNSVHCVSLELSGIPKTVSVYVRTVWTDSSQGLAGVQLLDLAEDDRELLRRWSALQAPEHEVFALSENAAESDCEVAPDAALADSASSRGIFDDGKNPAHPNSIPPHAPASPLYFWGAALAVMCLGTAWASTHNVLGEFKTPKPSSLASAVRPHGSRVQDAQPSNPQPVSSSASPAPESGTSVTSPLAATTSAANAGAPNLSNSIREADSRNRAAFSRSALSSINAPKKSSHFRDALPNESDSLPHSSHSDATSNPMPTARDTVRQPIPPTNSRTEITRNAVAEKSAIVGSTRLPKPLPSPSPSLGPTSTAKVVSPTPPSSYSSSIPASTIPPVIISRNTTHPTPALDAREPTPRPFIVELPVSGSNSLVSLPGERIINSPSVTMHVQRSVWLRGGLRFWRRRKKVQVGQLTAHADPQTPRGPRFGSITVQAMVDKQGRITGIRPLYGSIAFLPTVSRALSAWRYQPTYIDNKPVETVARIEVDFHSSSAR
jgi:PilZ domain